MNATTPDATEPTIVGRLAPSPTGGLHLGHARTFLIAWVAARAAGGHIVLRIEDLDASRVRPEARSGAVDDLRWLGLDWDEGPYVQSERTATYAASLERLKSLDAVYPCTCTRSEVHRAASAPHAEEEGPVYPGTCAGRTAADGDALLCERRPFAWRFRVGDATIAWDDLVLGRVESNPAGVGGDFPVGRSSGAPAYQLAVVVDDSAMGVTQVIRGDDLVPSTPRQVLLYRALGLTPPTFGHVPLAVGPDGRRLAKREGSIKLAALRAAGVDPRRLIGRLARSCGWTDGDEPSTPGAWTGRFRLDRLPRGPWVVSAEDVDALTRGDLP